MYKRQVKEHPDYYKLKKGKVKKVYRAWKLSKVIKGSKGSKDRSHRRPKAEDRKPYKLRGRRVYYARCSICGEFYRKNYRHSYITKKIGLAETKLFKVVEIYIDCKSHGEQTVDKYYESV